MIYESLLGSAFVRYNFEIWASPLTFAVNNYPMMSSLSVEIFCRLQLPTDDVSMSLSVAKPNSRLTGEINNL